MKINHIYSVLVLMVFIVGIFIGFLVRHNRSFWNPVKKLARETFQVFDNSASVRWGDDFELVSIESAVNTDKQSAFLFKSKSMESGPLIVSLHSWAWRFYRI